MDSDSNLEDELEEELFLDPEQIPPSLSTPRQRLEDARATARASIGCCSADDARGEPNTYTTLDGDTGWSHNCSLSTEEDSSMNLLLQILSSDGAGNGERECFDEISITESQRITLAEMNETLESLRRWRKQQRDIDPRTTDPECAPNNSTELLLLPDINPIPHWNRSSPETMTNLPRMRVNNGNCASPSLHDVADADSSCGEEARKQQVSGEEVVGGAQDPLVALWQEHHLRAQQAVGRLQEQLKHNIIITYPASQPRDSSTTIAAAEVVGDGKTEADAVRKVRKEAFPIQGLLASGRKCESPSKSSPPSSNGGGRERNSTEDRVSELRRDVDGLQMNQWIQHTRTKACDRAEALAREACDDIWRGTGSVAVGRIEGELDSFAKDLDVLLLRLDLDGGDDRGDELGQELNDVGSDGGDASMAEQHHVEDYEEERRAPVADAHVRHRAAAESSEQQR
ncbi:unnamed protein product [Ectocarpus sp. 8 AP-2014]